MMVHMFKMLFKTRLIVFVGVVACFAPEAEEKDACEDYELGPIQDFEVFQNEVVLALSWKRPVHFEDCLVQFDLHVQNVNTLEYLILSRRLDEPRYTFIYLDGVNVCVDLRATIYTYYKGLTPYPASNTMFVDIPFAEPGPPGTLKVERDSQYVTLKWTRAEGYEKCANYVMFYVSVFLKEDCKVTILPPQEVTTFEYSLNYFDQSHPYYCKEVVAEVRFTFKGNGKSKFESFTFGPPGC